MSDYHDLGNHGQVIATASPEAQRGFDCGLNWTFGFHHEDTIRRFERPLEANLNCQMAHAATRQRMRGPSSSYSAFN